MNPKHKCGPWCYQAHICNNMWKLTRIVLRFKLFHISNKNPWHLFFVIEMQLNQNWVAAYNICSFDWINYLTSLERWHTVIFIKVIIQWNNSINEIVIDCSHVGDLKKGNAGIDIGNTRSYLWTVHIFARESPTHWKAEEGYLQFSKCGLVL